MKKQFKKFLETANLDKKDKWHMNFILNYFDGKHPVELSNKTYMLWGDPGVGKTYIIEQLIKSLNIPIHYLGFTDLNQKNIIKYEHFEELAQNLKEEDCIILMDDINTILKVDDMFDLDIEHRNMFMKILENVKRSKKRKIFIATANETYCLPSALIDRIDVTICPNLPSDDNKKLFLENNFKKFLKKQQIKKISTYSIGSNFRDLPKIIKLSYNLGQGNITSESIKEALNLHTPSGLPNNMIKGVKTNFKDITGRSEIKEQLKKTLSLYKNRKLSKKLGLKRHNLLLFSGPPGTGKSLMARALAGETGFPIINFRARSIHQNGIDRILRLGKRYGNCILFIDEAEKILGKRSEFDADNMEHADINSIIEGIDDQPLKSLLIFAVNDAGRFGYPMKERFNVIEFQLPTEEERHEFVKRKISSSNLDIKIDLDSIARVTEGMSFREIENLWNKAIYHYVENRSITTELLTKIAHESRKIERDRDRMFG